MDIPQKIVWLASYPKSGNTWFRAFLTALFNEGEVNLNELKTNGIFSSRDLFYKHTDLNSAYLTDEEAKILQPRVFNQLAAVTEEQRLFIKVHDAYSYNIVGLPIIPTESTLCVVYIIRNPLDIVPSFANHLGITIDETVEFMNDKHARMTNQKDNLNTDNQVAQLLNDWSGHVESWTRELPFPVLTLRYEDMLINPLEAFSKAVRFIGIDAGEKQIEQAIAACQFDRLHAKEKETGFSEKGNKNRLFFRKGQAGNWKEELNEEQVKLIITSQEEVMRQYDYPVSII